MNVKPSIAQDGIVSKFGEGLPPDELPQKPRRISGGSCCKRSRNQAAGVGVAKTGVFATKPAAVSFVPLKNCAHTDSGNTASPRFGGGPPLVLRGSSDG